jgi:hypothetical protein
MKRPDMQAFAPKEVFKRYYHSHLTTHLPGLLH